MNLRNNRKDAAVPEPTLPEAADHDMPTGPTLPGPLPPRIVDLAKLEAHLAEKSDPLAYAQPEHRVAAVEQLKDNLPDLATKVIQQFAAMPTQELVDMVKAMDKESDAIKTDLLKMEAEWNARAKDVMARMRRLTGGCQLTKNTMVTLWEQIRAIDDQPLAEKPPVPAEAPAK